LQQGLGCHGGSISRSSRAACRVAGLALPEPARLLFACTIRGHRAAPLPLTDRRRLIQIGTALKPARSF
jgi:hypothetical protein